MKTILRYSGGKSRAIKKIGHVADDFDTVISPFIGGGSLEVHWAAQGKKVIGGDIFFALTNWWEHLLSNPEGLADEMRKINPTSEDYNRVKEELIKWDYTQEMLKDWKTDHYKRDGLRLDLLTAAAYYYFNHQCSYGPAYLGWASKVYLNESKWNGMVETTKNFKLPTLEVLCREFQTMFEDHPGDFFYLDPPYYLGEDRDNKMFKGIYPMRNIPVHHDGFDHGLLSDLIRAHDARGSKFALSYNDCSLIRELYKGFNFEYPEWHYSMGQGEKRIGKNRIKNGSDHTKKSHEILIHNL